MDKIKVLIADDVAQTREVIKKILILEKDSFEVVGEAANGDEVLKLIPKVQPHVVLMDINMPVLNGLEATEQISDLYPQVVVIIMSVQAENEYLKRAMFAGAKEYIIKPLEFESVVYTIKNTYEKQIKRQSINMQYKEEKKIANVFTFFSCKGGVGKSFLAVNAAITFSKELHKKTLLMDMDLLFGDISMLLNQPNHKTILDMIDEGSYDSYENIQSHIYTYNDHLDILFAPKSPESAEYIGKDMIEKIFSFVKRRYDVIVMDTGVNFSDLTLYLLDLSDKILLTTNMEISSLKDTKLGFNVMESLNYDSSKVKLIVNGINSNYGITLKDVEATFKDPIFTVIPEDIKSVRNSINRGIPLCSESKIKKSKVCKAIRKMCEDLMV